jgi:hypothetical protein
VRRGRKADGMWLKDLLKSKKPSVEPEPESLDIEIQVHMDISEPTVDASGIPTPVCPLCGSEWLMVPVLFDHETYDVASWGLEGECYSCHTKVTVCCPVDKEDVDDDEGELWIKQ